MSFFVLVIFVGSQLACGIPIGWGAALATDDREEPSLRFDGLVVSLSATAMWLVLGLIIGSRRLA